MSCLPHHKKKVARNDWISAQIDFIIYMEFYYTILLDVESKVTVI